MRTRHLRLVSHTHSVTLTSKSSVLSPFGPLKAGLTTWQTTQDQQLTVLLSSLERQVANLNYKSFTVLDTLTTATKAIRALHLDSTSAKVGTDD